MITLILCLIVAVLLPYIARIPLVVAMNQAGGYDNHHPRGQQARLKGFGARALAAHQNAFESLIVFTAAILLAIATNTTAISVQLFAVIHIGARIIYHILYLFDRSTLRSVVWVIAIGCALAIMWQCIPGFS